MNQSDSSQKPGNYLWVDTSRCIGCFSCETACKMEHELPAGPRPIRVMQIGPLEHGNELSMTYQPAVCLHCTSPACAGACPTGAMQKRSDGLVFADPELCIGCQSCAIACPFGIPQLNPGTGKIAKCDGCMDRGDQGLSPACVLACPTETLSFLTPVTKAQKTREQFARELRRTGAGK
jgi:Fe-S-cluster-containing dehydrogenase component